MLLVRPAIMAAITASLITIAGCGGTTSPTQPTASSDSTPSAVASSSQAVAAGSTPPAQAPPSGYQWLGSAEQRVWVAVPDSWVALDLSKLSYAAALAKFALKGQSTAAVKADIETLAQKHGLFAADVASAASSPNDFATNANAFCTSTPVEPGPGAASELDTGIRAEYASIHVHVISLKNTVVSDSQITMIAELSAQTTAGFTLTEIQEAELTSAGRICYLTMTTDRPTVYLPIFRKIAATLQVG